MQRISSDKVRMVKDTSLEHSTTLTFLTALMVKTTYKNECENTPSPSSSSSSLDS